MTRIWGNTRCRTLDMRTLAIPFLAATLTATACHTQKSSYTSNGTPTELVSDTTVRVPVATHDLLPGVILQTSDIS
jgi:hypothetical protein